MNLAMVYTAEISGAMRAWSVVKSHIPLIKFRKGGRMLTEDPHESKINVVLSQPTTPRRNGIDESELPVRYLRKPLTQLEIETIERGGPE